MTVGLCCSSSNRTKSNVYHSHNQLIMMEVIHRVSGQSENSSRSNKRKSGDLEEIENLVDANPLPLTAAKKSKGADVPSTKENSTIKGVKSALPRYNSTRSKVNNTVVLNTTHTSAASTTATAATPRSKGPNRAQTPCKEVLKTSSADAALQEALAEVGFNTVKPRLDAIFCSNNEKMASIGNSLKVKSKASWDTKEKLKRQENALKEFKDLLTHINEELHATIDGCDNIDKRLIAVVTRSVNQRFADLSTITTLKDKECELQRVKEAIAEERGNFKTSLLQLQIQYDEKIHKLESNQLSQSKELVAKEKELAQLENNLKEVKREYEAAQKDWSCSVEQRTEALASKFEGEVEALKDEIKSRDANLKKLATEKDELQAINRSLSEEIMKLQVNMESSDKLSNRKEEEMTRLVQEVDRLKQQVNQKDEDLRNAMTSVRDMQKQAQEEKTNFWGEFSALNSKFQNAEEERRCLFSQLAEKKEEVALLTRDLLQLKGAKEELEGRLQSQEAELVDSKELRVQLEIEKKLRAKVEMHEENERRERTAAVAQLMAIQSEAQKKVQEAEQARITLEQTLQKELNEINVQKLFLSEEAKQQSDIIAGLRKEVENLHLALENAQPNHKSFEELSRASGELEVLRRRLKEAIENQDLFANHHTRQITELQEKLNISETQRRKLHNVVQELRGNIRVFARVRPFLPSDGLDLSSSPESCILAKPELSSLQLRSGSNSERSDDSLFSFDKVFGPSSSQEIVFDEVSEFVQSALDGYNVCLFSYGQTGSGKTHTMNGSGTGSMKGIIPRAMEQVGAYRKALQEKGWVYHMEVSFVEIYNESIRDLLREGDQEGKHDIKRDAQGNVFVSDVNKVPVDPEDEDQINAVMETAAQHRSVASTMMNERSSRSHAIFTLYLTASNAEQGIQLNGALNLVDLAGSERLDRSGVTGSALKETVAINKSLSSLADVFNALAKKQPHVPYRNSKLTHLLQPCLSGDGKTLMIVNLSPTEESYHETLSSLRFANQVNQCELGKPKRRLKDVAQGVSTPVSLSHSLTESLSAKKATHNQFSSSLTKLDDFKENSANTLSSTLGSVSEKSATKKKPTVVKAATGTRKPPLSAK